MPPAARRTDLVIGTDIHIDLVPAGAGYIPTPLPYPFHGPLLTGTTSAVLVNGLELATVGTIAVNTPPHVPAPGPFQKPPHNTGVVVTGSTSVLIGGRPAARVGDLVRTCNDPQDQPVAMISTGSRDVEFG